MTPAQRPPADRRNGDFKDLHERIKGIGAYLGDDPPNPAKLPVDIHPDMARQLRTGEGVQIAHIWLRAFRQTLRLLAQHAELEATDLAEYERGRGECTDAARRAYASLIAALEGRYEP